MHKYGTLQNNNRQRMNVDSLMERTDEEYDD